MARNLTLWFPYLVVVGVFSAYIAGRALPVGSPYLPVFRFGGAAAFLGYSAALWQMSMWYRRGLGITIRVTVDGLIHALVTAGTFGWLSRADPRARALPELRPAWCQGAPGSSPGCTASP